ncbi:MAG: response regulator [Candidatus Latescibacterota bacterium]|jgi:excisionase family DNA binding protein
MKECVLLTTGKVAAHCGVSYETVNQWIRRGKLAAYTTPGGHYRIHRDDFGEFLKRYNMLPLERMTAGKPRILVVDDDPDVVRVMRRLLARTGQYEIATAADGFEAGLQVAQFRPDLITLDLMMPQMDGFQVCRLVKANPQTRHIIILILTGFASQENVQQALECGADCCLEKPFRLGELGEKVGELLARRPQTRPGAGLAPTRTFRLSRKV